MKRLILFVSAALVLAAEAKLEKVVDVTLADQQGLVNAATKIGGFINEPMLGMMPAGLFAANPLATQGFGPARGDANFYAAVYADETVASLSLNEISEGDKFNFAVLYPATSSKAGFLAANTHAKEENGVITWNEMSVIFSADGKYAAVASDADAAREALAGAAKIPALKKDEAIRVRLFNAGMQLMVKALESDADMKACPELIDICKSVTRMEFSLCAGDYGIDLRGSVGCTQGSLLSKLGNKPLSSGTPLQFAGKDALIACAYAADAAGSDSDAQWKKLMAFAAKWGVKTDWVSYEKKGVGSKIVIDPVALANYIKSEGEAKCEELEKNAEKVCEDVMALFKPAIEIQSPEQACALYLKGAKVPVDAQTRFDKVLPDFSRKPCASVGVFSLYGTIKSVGEVVCPLIDDKDAKEAKAFLAQLPAADGCAIAYAWTKKGPTVHEYTARVNPAEIRNLYVAIQMMQAEYQRKIEATAKAIEDAN
ncbi:MAG: hypothetical protein IKC27_01770 [Kiritimatiellae bacterium]|nr:hypothetical protein [Kiritimatiellia bacterium]